ncbi:MAG TPA: thermonuclease family protein [Sphingobacteriaceae bacterium]
MRKSLFAFFLLLVTSLAAVGQSSITGRVIAIADGDTFTMLVAGNRQVKVRFHGIDCPEKKQDFGTRAREFTAGLVFGETVTVRVKDVDRYGRTVGLVILAGGKSLQEELLKNGLAWHYKKYDKTPRFAFLEAEARRRKAGLWSMPNPVAPWDFRKNPNSGRSMRVIPNRRAEAGPSVPCGARTDAGKPCRRLVKGGGHCYQHT